MRNNLVYSGFSYAFIPKNFCFFKGFNEGYTELLTIRTFNKTNPEDYQYKVALKIAAIIEILFDDPREMELAYINCITELPYYNFLKYGTKKEFLYICKQIDINCASYLTTREYDKLIFLLYDIVKRTKDKNRVENCERIIEEKNPYIKKYKF